MDAITCESGAIGTDETAVRQPSAQAATVIARKTVTYKAVNGLFFIFYPSRFNALLVEFVLCFFVQRFI